MYRSSQGPTGERFVSLTRSQAERDDLLARGLWSRVSLGAHLRRLARDRPDHIALADERRRLSYSEYWQEVARLANKLSSRGVRPGDRVGLMMGNCVEFCIARLAASEAGAISVILNRGWSTDVLDTALVATGCTGVLMAGVPEGVAASIATAVDRTSVDWAADVALHPPKDLAAWYSGADGFGTETLESTRRAPWDVDDVLFTSGTTGLPKPVMSSQCRWMSMCEHQRRSGGLGPEDVGLVVSPVGGSIGYLKSTVLALLVGGTTVLSEATGRTVLGEAAACHATWIATVPTVTARIVAALADDEAAGLDLSALRVVFNGGAPLAPAVASGLRDRLGCFVMTSIGSTEAGAPAGTRLGDTGEQQTQTVGSAYPGGRLGILGADGAVHASGRGELVSKSPSFFDGYLDDPAATARCFHDGWIRHHDEVRLGDDGYVRFVGRVDDAINRGGMKFSPAVVEAALLRHPAVDAAAVFPVDDPGFGQRVAAALVLRPQETLEGPDLASWLSAQVGRHERPDVVYVVDRLPETSNRKVDRRSLASLSASWTVRLDRRPGRMIE